MEKTMILEALRRYTEAKLAAEEGIRSTCQKTIENICNSTQSKFKCEDGTWLFRRINGTFIDSLELECMSYLHPDSQRLKTLSENLATLARDIYNEYQVNIWEFLPSFTPPAWGEWEKELENKRRKGGE